MTHVESSTVIDVAGDLHSQTSATARTILHQPRPPRLRADATCRKPSRARCSRATRDRRSRCAGCSSTSSPANLRRRPGRAPRRSASNAPTSSTRRCFNEYGDDSVAQLGGAHIACEGRLERPHQGARVGTPDGVSRAVHALRAVHRQAARPLALPRAGRTRRLALRERYVATMDRGVRDLRALDPGDAEAHFARALPEGAAGLRRRPSSGHPRQGARHAARPAAGGDASNVGIFGTGQAFEALLLRMRAHPLEEVRAVRRPDARRSCAR